MSITWLEWVVEKQRREGIIPIYIQHALNEGEQRLSNSKYKLNGYCRETITAHEFHGCLWHRCLTCYSQQEKRRIRVPRTDQTLDELYAHTRKKKKIIKYLGMTPSLQCGTMSFSHYYQKIARSRNLLHQNWTLPSVYATFIFYAKEVNKKVMCWTLLSLIHTVKQRYAETQHSFSIL